MTTLATLREFGRFLKTHKRYWLVPLLVMLIVFGALLFFTESSAAAPFIYTLF